MHEPIFPKEVTGQVPRITLTGREQLHVEQHRGLIDYTQEHIVLRTRVGPMRIVGAGLCFRVYTAQEAVIQGRVDSVSFSAGEVQP